MSFRSPHRVCAYLLAFSPLLLAGCGADYKARAVVKGKVTIGQGLAKTTLTAGTVTFYGSHNITSTAPIDESGNYTMNDAPIGDVKVTVVVNLPPGLSPGPKGGAVVWAKEAGGGSKDTGADSGGGAIPAMSKIPTKVVRIQDKYANPDTSGLTYRVEKGEHTYDIELGL